MTDNKPDDKVDYSNVFNMIEGEKYTSSQSLLPHKEHKKLTISDISLTSLKLGCMAFGGSEMHMKLIHSALVEKNDLLDEGTFNNVTDLCLLLPGYSSSTLLAAMITINTQNAFKGALGLFFYNLPSLFMIVIFAYIMNIIKLEVRPSVTNYDPDAMYFTFKYDAIMISLWTLAAGLAQSALALLVNSAVGLTRKLSNNKFQLILVGISMIIYLYNGDYTFIFIIMVISGMASMIRGDHDYLFGIPKHGEDDIFKTIPFTGITCLLVYFVLLMGFRMLYYEAATNIYAFLGFSWFKIGAISIGEGNVMIPMILSEYKTIVEEAEVLNGYALVSLLPGSILNTAAYIGVITSNIIGGILSGFLIFIPGFLFMLFALPYFTNIKYSTGFQFFIRGANSAAVGFIFACVIKLWYDSCIVNPYTSHLWGSVNVVMCYFLCEKFGIHKTFVLGIGALFNLGMEVLMYLMGRRV